MDSYTISWTDSAKYDLESIISYIKLDSIATAKEVFFAIKHECEQLNYTPKQKRVVPELQQIGINHNREIIFKRWRIIFKIEKSNVSVLAVVDNSRNIEDILFQRLMK